jgi:hypothetical protein
VKDLNDLEGAVKKAEYGEDKAFQGLMDGLRGKTSFSVICTAGVTMAESSISFFARIHLLIPRIMNTQILLSVALIETCSR